MKQITIFTISFLIIFLTGCGGGGGGSTGSDIQSCGDDYEQLSFLETFNPKKTISIDENYSVIAEGASGLSIVDIRDKKNPLIMKSVNFGTTTSAILKDNYIYAKINNTSLSIINITDKLNPVKTADINITTANVYDSSYAIDSNYLYYANYLDSKLHIVDITNKSNPIEVSSVDYNNTAGYTATRNIVVSSNTLYLTLESGIVIYDISDKLNPIIKSRISNGYADNFIAIKNNYLFLGRPSYNTLTSYNISDTTNPYLISNYSGSNTHKNFILDSDNELISIDYSGRNILFTNVSNPSAMVEDSTYFVSSYEIFDIKYNDGYLYSLDESGIRIYSKCSN